MVPLHVKCRHGPGSLGPEMPDPAHEHSGPEYDA